ncbi:TetR/AcrR family transcriptional regulator [Anaeromicrobium sediminis]|uniref:HTH tetR-type domain-containing protein n=1 Tax=Anaeromicrobium sediminis TaxID=1478221 RepID=A0A267MGN5_9FIRM|nr:TetR/AcrR family transcriptional regulator [Anaeromicrobium sediminis]PAB58627.1 hypothetical protein CCE28_14185 [Anaeromicrobium sediminis]
MDKKEMIMEAALRLFNEFGFHGTPTSKIAKEAGVSNGTLFNYFSTKEELINTLYLEHITGCRDCVFKELNKDLSVKETMKYLWANAIRWHLKRPEMFKFMEQFAHSPYINNIGKEKKEELFRFAHGLVDKGISHGMFRYKNTKLICCCMEGALSHTTRYLLENENEDMDDVIEESFNMLWQGIGL